jgi:glycosyltransferase involved in cell wall biosynthesis
VAGDLKVVHVVVAGDIGGAERLLVDLASRPRETGAAHAVALLTPNPKLKAMLDRAGLAVHDGGPIRENPIAYLRRSLGFRDVAWIAGVLQRERAHIAHLHTFGSHVVGTRAARRARIPALRTEHHIQYFNDPSTAAFTRWSLRRVQCSVAISRYVRDFVARVAPYAAAKLRVVRNGVDADRFAVAAPPAGGPFTFAVVSRLERWKRVDRVIEALESVAGARLLVVGEGGERPSLERLAARLGVRARVEFRGYQSDPRPAVSQAHACVNASDDEPLGLSVLEAMSTGRPVIAYAGGAMPELIVSGERGWLVAERTTDALARAMLETSCDRARAAQMGLAARAFVDRECRIESMCREYGAVYRELAQR